MFKFAMLKWWIFEMMEICSTQYKGAPSNSDMEIDAYWTCHSFNWLDWIFDVVMKWHALINGLMLRLIMFLFFFFSVMFQLSKNKCRFRNIFNYACTWCIFYHCNIGKWNNVDGYLMRYAQIKRRLVRSY